MHTSSRRPDRHPDLKVRLRALPYPEIRAAVSSGQVDVGFLLQPPVHPTSYLTVAHLRPSRC